MPTSSQVVEGAGAAEVGVAEAVYAVPESVGHGHEQAVVGHALIFEGAAHLESEAIADQHERYVVLRVGVAFAELVGPDDGGVIQQATLPARLRRFGKA